MTARAVSKELARLSYSDTMILAKHIANRLPQVSVEAVAEVLATLFADEVLQPDPIEAKSDEHLKRVFSGRAKSIHCQGGPMGWTVQWSNHTAVGLRLPDAINNLLDQLTTMQAMGVL
jgi:hypothetical protein